MASNLGSRPRRFPATVLFVSMQVSLLFEVEDLAVASPATVSRCGMVFNDIVDLGWQPYVDSWLSRRQDKVYINDGMKFYYRKYILYV